MSTPESLLRSIQVRASSRSSKTPPGNCELPLKHQIVAMCGLWNFNLADADGQMQRRSIPSRRLASSGTHVGHKPTVAFLFATAASGCKRSFLAHGNLTRPEVGREC